MDMFRPVRGMKDLFGSDIDRYQFIINKAIEIGKKYGFLHISTPILEHTDVFKRSIGDETDVVSKEMYTFEDRGGESLTLRPEGTAGVVRAIVSESLYQNLPVKLMYHGEMFRYDRPQKGRYRQFRQLGFEHIGEKNPYIDALTIAMGNEILHAIGVFDFRIFINTLGDDETRTNYTKALVKYLSRHKDSLSKESQIRLDKNPMRILDSKDKMDNEICSMAPLIVDYISKEAGNYFEKVCMLLDKIDINYDVDNFLVRGLDYYSHTAFEFKSIKEGSQSALGGGGRYDKLLKMFGGPDVSGIGFAFGVERLMLHMQREHFDKRIKTAVIPVSDNENDIAFETLISLHNAGLNAEIILGGNISKKMKHAHRQNCDIAVIIGENEIADNKVTVKFMQQNDIDNKMKSIHRSVLIPFLKDAYNI